MITHKIGDETCIACRAGYPKPCQCGGLVHATQGCILETLCDNCDSPNPIETETKANES